VLVVLSPYLFVLAALIVALALTAVAPKTGAERVRSTWPRRLTPRGWTRR
jgi:hypothetical protein